MQGVWQGPWNIVRCSVHIFNYDYDLLIDLNCKSDFPQSSCTTSWFIRSHNRGNFSSVKIRRSCELRQVTSESLFVYTRDLYLPAELVSCLENIKRLWSSSSSCSLVPSGFIYFSLKYLQRKRLYSFLW